MLMAVRSRLVQPHPGFLEGGFQQSGICAIFSPCLVLCSVSVHVCVWLSAVDVPPLVHLHLCARVGVCAEALAWMLLLCLGR